MLMRPTNLAERHVTWWRPHPTPTPTSSTSHSAPWGPPSQAAGSDGAFELRATRQSLTSFCTNALHLQPTKCTNYTTGLKHWLLVPDSASWGSRLVGGLL